MKNDLLFQLYPLGPVDLVGLPDKKTTLIHKKTLPALLELKEEAKKEGLDLQVSSSFRSFTYQLNIWNEKANSKRKVFNDQEEEIELKGLSNLEKIHHILRFSALPGLSRHHWGSDLDVFEGSFSPCLLPSKYAPGGPFAELSSWLQRKAQNFDFFFPYDKDRGGVAPEPWHLSYRPVATQMLTPSREDYKLFYSSLPLPFALLKTVRENLDEIIDRYLNCAH